MSQKVRLDIHLTNKGLIDSRQKAQRIILAGKVKDKNGKVLDKPGQKVSVDLDLEVISEPKFVSRGGDKLAEAFNRFPINVENRVCIDAGISTGGFSDCLLQKGAELIYGIDVGYGQTAWNIRNNPKVKLYERTNIRYLDFEYLYSSNGKVASFVAVDLSFISLKLVLNPILGLLNQKFWEGIFLIKPQFEVGREKVSKGGVVRDASDHIEVIESLCQFFTKNKCLINGLTASPLKGPAGNHEYLIWLSNEKKVDLSVDSEYINRLVRNIVN